MKSRLGYAWVVCCAVPSLGAEMSLVSASPGSHSSADLGSDRAGFVTPILISGTQSITTIPSGTGVGTNTVLQVFLGTGPVVVTGIGWNVSIETFGGSWFSDATIGYGPQGGAPAIFARPGAGNNSSGGPSVFVQPRIKLNTINIPDLVLPNGWLELVFFEQFDDVTTSPFVDAVYTGALRGDTDFRSILEVQWTPEPTSAVILLVGAVAMASQRRS